MASCVQIWMHYALFVFCGTGLDSCLQSVLNCVCKSCDYNEMYNVCVFVKFGRLMVRELLPLLVMRAASTFKLWSDVVDTRCLVKTFTSTNTSTRNTLSSRSENLTSLLLTSRFSRLAFSHRM